MDDYDKNAGLGLLAGLVGIGLIAKGLSGKKENSNSSSTTTNSGGNSIFSKTLKAVSTGYGSYDFEVIVRLPGGGKQTIRGTANGVASEAQAESYILSRYSNIIDYRIWKR